MFILGRWPVLSRFSVLLAWPCIFCREQTGSFPKNCCWWMGWTSVSTFSLAHQTQHVLGCEFHKAVLQSPLLAVQLCGLQIPSEQFMLQYSILFQYGRKSNLYVLTSKYKWIQIIGEYFHLIFCSVKEPVNWLTYYSVHYSCDHEVTII